MDGVWEPVTFVFKKKIKVFRKSYISSSAKILCMKYIKFCGHKLEKEKNYVRQGIDEPQLC